MYNFCTLFDIRYLSRGLVMYQSLKQHCPNFYLYIFAFDEQTYQYLLQQKLEKVKVISLKEFETKQILEVKKTRTQKEYCWTCTPLIILHAIQKYNLINCTYVDADLFFFDNPKYLIEEMGNKSVLITEHRHSYKKVLQEGIYCVQFTVFKNTKEGMKVLNWWAEACLEWCYDRKEDNKFGDQKYLDDWTTRFKGVHVLEHLGGGVAPWNCQQYNLEKDKKNKVISLIEKKTNKKYPLIFYHFHHFILFRDERIDLAAHFFISPDFRKLVYQKYLKEMIKIEKKIIVTIKNYLKISRPKFKKNSFLRKVKYFIKGIKNISSISKLLKS